MSRKAQLTLGLLVLLMLAIATVSAGPRIISSLGLDLGGDKFTLPEKQPFPGWVKRSNSVMVVSCEKGFYWEDLSKGESICNLPSGEITAGDVVKNCQGYVVLIHIPSNRLIFEHYFTPTNIEEYPNVPKEPDTPIDPIPEIPTEKTTITITKPMGKTTYLWNLNVKSSDTAKILGYIDIEAELDNPAGIEIKEVRFYIDDTLRNTDDEAPYSWRWAERVIGEKTIKVVAISDTNEEVASAEIFVSIFNLNFKQNNN